MPVFKRNNGTPVTGEVTLVVGNNLKLKLDGEPKTAATVAHFALRSDMPDAVAITQSPDERRREQNITITANRTTASAIAVRAYHADGNAAASVRPLRLRIVPRIALPGENTDAAILARLLLAENISPGKQPDYGDGEAVFETMRLMRAVLENRIKAARQSPALGSYIVCSPASLDFRGVIFANRCGGLPALQFDGFVNGAIQPGKLREIDGMVSIANDGSHSSHLRYRRHVEKAIQIAEGPSQTSAGLDASSLLYWRTKNAGIPTPYGIKRISIGGQDFYSVTAGYLNDPHRPGPVP